MVVGCPACRGPLGGSAAAAPPIDEDPVPPAATAAGLQGPALAPTAPLRFGGELDVAARLPPPPIGLSPATCGPCAVSGWRPNAVRSRCCRVPPVKVPMAPPTLPVQAPLPGAPCRPTSAPGRRSAPGLASPHWRQAVRRAKLSSNPHRRHDQGGPLSPRRTAVPPPPPPPRPPPPWRPALPAPPKLSRAERCSPPCRARCMSGRC